MKKLLLLTLVLLGGVMQVSAENVTRRFYIISSGNFGQYRKGNLAIHSWYTGGADITTWGTSAEEMSSIGTNTKGTNAIVLWYKDVTFDGSKEINIKVYDKDNTSWQSGNLTVTSSSNKYYTFDITSKDALSVKGDLSYCAYLATGGSWIKQELVTEDNYVYTTTIDNQTSPDPSLELLIAPSFAVDDDLVKTSDLRLEWMFRPWNENQDLGFTDQTSKKGGFYANDNSLKLKSSAFFDLTYKPLDWEYSLSPYIPKTITSVEYATLGTPDGWKMKVPEGVTAYYVTGVADGEATMSSAIAKDKTLPGNNGFLIQGSAGNYKFYASNDDPESTEGNKMVSTGENGVAASSVPDGAYILALNDKGDEACFYKYSGTGDISAFKAYLNADGISAKSLAFNFDGNKEEEEVTAINAIANTVDSNAAMFNLSGQRVNNDYKGVVVKNGKKFIVK